MSFSFWLDDKKNGRIASDVEHLVPRHLLIIKGVAFWNIYFSSSFRVCDAESPSLEGIANVFRMVVLFMTDSWRKGATKGTNTLVFNQHLADFFAFPTCL